MPKKKKLKDVFIETEDEKIPLEQFMVHWKRQYIALSDTINDKLLKLETYKLRKKTMIKMMDEVNDLKNMLLQIWQWYFSAFVYAEKEWVQDELLQNKFLSEDWESEESRKKFEDFKLKMAESEAQKAKKAIEIWEEIINSWVAPTPKVDTIVVEELPARE